MPSVPSNRSRPQSSVNRHTRAKPFIKAPATALAIALTSLLPATRTRAQSCAAADSAIGAKPARHGILTQYDKMTDSTMITAGIRVVVPMSGGEKFLSLVAAFEGKRPSSVPMPLLMYRLTTQTQSAALDRGARRAPTKENAKIASDSVALILVDDSIRLRLPRIRYDARIEEGMLTGQHLVEQAWFRMTPEQVLEIGRARKTVFLRIGQEDGDLRGDEIESARELWRFLICAGVPRPQ